MAVQNGIGVLFPCIYTEILIWTTDYNKPYSFHSYPQKNTTHLFHSLPLYFQTRMQVVTRGAEPRPEEASPARFVGYCDWFVVGWAANESKTSVQPRFSETSDKTWLRWINRWRGKSWEGRSVSLYEKLKMQSFKVFTIFSAALLAFSVDARVYFKEQFLEAGKLKLISKMLAKKELSSNCN